MNNQIFNLMQSSFMNPFDNIKQYEKNFETMYQEMTSLFSEAKGFDFMNPNLFFNPFFQMGAVLPDIKAFFNSYFSLFGFVSSDVHVGLVKKYDDLKKLKEKFEKENNETQKKINTLNKTLTDTKKKTATKQDDEKKHADEIKALKSDIAKQKKELTSKIKEMKTYESKVKELEKTIADLNKSTTASSKSKK